MATNVTEKDKTLKEVIDWCENKRSDTVKFLQRMHWLGFHATTLCNGHIQAYEDVINHCKDMLGDTGSTPSDAPNQSEEAK